METDMETGNNMPFLELQGISEEGMWLLEHNRMK